MKNKYLSLLFASFLVISGCETIGGSSSSDSPSYEYGDSRQANLQGYLQNEIDWEENWSLCEKKYLNYNIRLGYEVKDISKFNNEEWILLWRQKKY